MPPKCRFTKKEIITAALDLTREHGISAVTARAVGTKLSSSSKVIFSIFENMEELHAEVIAAANEIYERFLAEDMSAGQYPIYKASGMAYIRFARQEKELFKLLFMRDRTRERQERQSVEIEHIISIIQEATGLPKEKAYMFHLEMWVYVHGIATMIATDYLAWETGAISRMLTDAYEGLKYRYCNEEGKNGSDKNSGSHKKI